MSGADHGPGDVGFATLIGLELTDVEPGYSRGELTVTDELKNPNDVLHGAVTHAMADTGMGAALTPDLAEGKACATIEIKISYLKPVWDGTLTCETTLIDRGGRVAFLESAVRQDGESVARVTGSFAIFEQ
jgi:acyl-CoA thioesterase